MVMSHHETHLSQLEHSVRKLISITYLRMVKKEPSRGGRVLHLRAQQMINSVIHLLVGDVLSVLFCDPQEAWNEKVLALCSEDF